MAEVNFKGREDSFQASEQSPKDETKEVKS